MRPVRGAVAGGIGAGLVLGALASGCPSGVFTCTDDAQCEGGEGPGRCEATGFCSFPDESCPGGHRYGEHSSEVLAGQCVPVDEGTGTSDPGPTSGPMMSTGGSSASSGGDDLVDSTGPVVQTSGDPADLSFTDDQWRGEFAAGSVEGLTWDGSALRLAEGQTEGVLVSRPFDAEQLAQWTTLAWWARGPHGKPLPDGGEAEVGWSADGIDMRDNLLLLHLDVGSGPLRSGALVPDASGTGHDALVDGTGASGGIGRFGGALADAATSRLLVDPAEFEPDEDDFTWAAWVRVSDCAVGPAIIGMYDAVSSSSPNVWLACIEAMDWPECPGSAEVGRAAFMVSANEDQSGGGGACGTATIDDGQWHHVVATKQGHAPATLRTYVDGVLDAETVAMIDGPILFPSDVELSIGAHPPGDVYQFEGGLDEVAIWRRALDEDEVSAMYRRGVLHLSLGVRTCADPTCASAGSFEGPDGSSDPFVELAGALAPGTVHPLALEGSVLQYRARLESLVPGLSPGLEAVTITADLP